MAQENAVTGWRPDAGQLQADSASHWGIALFVLLTFGVTWAADFAMIARGVRFDSSMPLWAFAVVAGTMLVPAASAYVVRRWATPSGFSDAGLHFGPWRIYLIILITVPMVFVGSYLLSTLVGTARLDLSAFSDHMAAASGSRNSMLARMTPKTAVMVALVASVTIAPLFNCLFTFGEEFGWTGYLLPELLFLGKWRAVIAYGLIWGLWHAPLVAEGYNYPGHPITGVALMCLFTVAIGLTQASLRVRYGSVLLTTWLHACVNAQGRGVVPLIFAVSNPVLGGFTGIIGLAMIGTAGTILWTRTPEPRARAVAPHSRLRRVRGIASISD